MAEYDVQEAVIVNRGFQFQNNWHFNHQIKCVTQQTSDAVFVFYNVGSDNIASLCPYKQHNPRTKHSLPSNVSNLIYIRKFRLLIASCPDLTLRIYSEHFELIDTVHIRATILSLAFNETTSELYTGGIGHINTWLLRHKLHNPLIPSKKFTACSVKKHQWVISLDFDPSSEILVATCQDAVYVINTRTHSQTNCFSNTHHGSLTSAVFFHPLEYVITAAKDHSLKVWNCILNSEVHTLTGHLKVVTGLKVHPTAPCVISCSLDASIRTWNLENMTQCCYLNCGEQLLGMCTDFPLGNRLSCYSHYSIMMWQVNQVETHFASVNSHLVSMSRVEDTSQRVTEECTKARILALAEDGGVRLLSPVTGQVITILFPMSSSQLLKDVVYSLKDSLLFVLLKTSEVIVFDATTNPCSARELWVAPSDKQLLSITLCCVLLGNGDTCYLVFGGEKSGHIALLFSSGEKLSMPHPCPAHGGHVTKLIASCDNIVPFCSDDQHQSSTKIVQTALISYGTDNMLNVWCLKLKKKNRVTLKLQNSIHMGLEPVHGKLFSSLLCLSLPDNRIVMINTPKIQQQQDTRVIATTDSFSKMSLLTHQAEDDHTDAIIALQCCPKLNLFATSSMDGLVKVWNEENHLISEIEFGESLASVCFANSSGDLLVGFQKHISLIQARDYLPESIINANYRDTLLEDCLEQPMTFDSDLEFWYDSERTPCSPAEQEGRRQWSRGGSGNSVYHDHQATIEDDQSSSTTEALAAEMRASAKSLQSKMDSCMAQKLSQEYAEELHSQSPSKLKKHRRMPHRVPEPGGERDAEHLTLRTISSLPAVSPSSSNCLHESVSGGHLACAAGGKSSRKKRNSSSQPAQLPQRIMSVKRKVQLPKAEVLPLQVPSAKFPIAPDGFIPNSILRRKFTYTPPVVILKPYQPPSIKKGKNRAANMSRNGSDDVIVKKNRAANLSRNGSNCLSTAISGEQLVDYSGSNDVIVTCISRERSSQERRNRRPAASRQKSFYSGYLHPNSAAPGSNFDWNESQYSESMTFSSSSDFAATNHDHSSIFEHKTPSRDHHSIQGLSPDRDKMPEALMTSDDTIASKSSKIDEVDDTIANRFSKTDNDKQVADSHTKLTIGVQSSKVKDTSLSTAEEEKVENSQRRQSLYYSGAKASLDGLGQSQMGSGATNILAAGHKSCDHTAHARPVQVEVHRSSLPINLNHSRSEMSVNFSREVIATKSFPKRSSSVSIFKGSHGAAAAHRKSVNYSIVKLDSLHVVALKKIQNSSWYPKDRRSQVQGDPEGLTEVVNTLISMQQNSTMPIFNEICSALLELNKEGALSEGQKRAIANELSRRLSFSSADNAPLRAAALRTLEKIGVGSKQMILRILPLLTDPDIEVRYAAFSALRALTGVSNRSQLQRLLIKLGLLQHVTIDQDEIMSELADRVESGSIQLSPNSRILDACKVGANFGQRAADIDRSYYTSNTNFRDPLATKSHTGQRATNSNSSYYASNTNYYYRDSLATKAHTESSDIPGQRATNSSYYGSNTNYYRDPFAIKSHNYSPGLPVSPRSRKKRSLRCHTLSERTDQSTKQRYGQLEPLNNSPLHSQSGTYPGCDSVNNYCSFSRETRYSSQSGYERDSLSMQGEGLFTHGHLSSAAAARAFKFSTKSKIQELVLRRPMDYSQSRPAARLMLGTCGNKVAGKLTTEEYEWSEIFRVVRRASRSVSRSDPEFTSVGVLYKVTQLASGKLPQIDTQRAKIDQICGSQLINEQLRSADGDQENESTSETVNLLPGLQSREEVFSDTDSENAGLVIELPEIASDVIRVAQKS